MGTHVSGKRLPSTNFCISWNVDLVPAKLRDLAHSYLPNAHHPLRIRRR